jgi:hypothetical protein
MFAHHSVFESGGVLEGWAWPFGITLALFLTSIASVHGIGKGENTSRIWDPMMAVLIIGFVCWHIIDAVQRQTKTSFIAMVILNSRNIIITLLYMLPLDFSLY